MKDRELEAQGKDFAEVLVNRLEDAYHAYAGLIENPSADDPEILEAANFRRKAREDALQALRVPSPPSEDFPDMRDQFAMAALPAIIEANKANMEISFGGEAEQAYKYASAMMKAREVKP